MIFSEVIAIAKNAAYFSIIVLDYLKYSLRQSKSNFLRP